ncbi:MAG: hypothetical protein WD249_11320 [Gaiellaceae bacterium]
MTDKLVKTLRKWLGQAPPAPSPPSAADDELANIREGMAAIRELLRRFGAALGAGSAAILTGLGYTQVHQLFPLPADSNWRVLASLAAISALAALVGAAWLTGRFFSAQRRIVIDASQQKWRSDRLNRQFGDEEQELREREFAAGAAEYGAGSLEALELRARRLHRIGLRAAPATRRGYAEEAEAIEKFVRLVLWRAALRILEWRSHQAYRGWRTMAATLLTIAGILGIFGLADWSKGQRDLIALRKECALATKEGATDACAPVVPASATRTAKDKEAAAQHEAAALAERAAGRIGRGAPAISRASDCWLVIQADKTLAGADQQARRAALLACLVASGAQGARLGP